MFFSPLHRTAFEIFFALLKAPHSCYNQWGNPGALKSEGSASTRDRWTLSSAAPGSSWHLLPRAALSAAHLQVLLTSSLQTEGKSKALVQRWWIISLMGHGWKPNLGHVRLERAVKWKHCQYYIVRPSRPGPHAVNWTPRRGRREGGRNMRQSQMDQLQVEEKRAQWLCLNWSKHCLLLLRSSSPRINVKTRWLREQMASWWQ